MPQLPLFALQVERYEQQQHHTSGRGTTPAPLPYAGAAQLPAFQLRAQPLQGQGAAAEHVLGGSQEVWQQEGIMPGLQAGHHARAGGYQPHAGQLHAAGLTWWA